MSFLKGLKPVRLLVATVLLVAAVALIRDTAYQGQDFKVFWKAARGVLKGRDIYSTAQYGPMVFKYPPWTVPVFLPFALLPLKAAKWLWGSVQILSLFAIVSWLIREGCAPRRVILVMAAFWGIWVVHAMDGQVVLSMTAIALWGWSATKARGGILAIWALSTKIFTGFAVLGMIRRLRSVRVLLLLMSLSALSLPVYLSSNSRTPGELVSHWAKAASSGGKLFRKEKIRGRENQGLPALALRVLKVKSKRTEADIVAAVGVAVVLGSTWVVVSARLAGPERWSGWLALSAVIHPLAWFHLFAIAFPAVALSVERAFARRDRLAMILAVLGMSFVALVTKKTLGPVGAVLELASIKSIGVLLCLAALIRTSSRAGATDVVRS